MNNPDNEKSNRTRGSRIGTGMGLGVALVIFPGMALAGVVMTVILLQHVRE